MYLIIHRRHNKTEGKKQKHLRSI